MTIEIAREIAARIWYDEEYENFAMNAELAEAIAHLLLNEAEQQNYAEGTERSKNKVLICGGANSAIITGQWK